MYAATRAMLDIVAILRLSGARRSFYYRHISTLLAVETNPLDKELRNDKSSIDQRTQ